MEAKEKTLDLKLGYACNNNCIHCVVAHLRYLGDKSYDEIISEMKGASGSCNKVIFTGGEPLIRPDIFRLVDSAKGFGFEKIIIQTNGRMLSYKDFAERLVGRISPKRLVFIVAFQSNDPKTHQDITRSPGSWEQTVQGIKNLKRLGQVVTSQAVVTKQNYQSLPEIARFLIGLDVDRIQFTFVHPAGNAWEHFDKVVPDISKAAPFLHKALDAATAADKDAEVEGFPFCFMRGYENRISESKEYRRKAMELRALEESNPEFNHIERNYKKCENCSKCRYDRICPGTWSEYIERKGHAEFRQVL